MVSPSLEILKEGEKMKFLSRVVRQRYKFYDC